MADPYLGEIRLFAGSFAPKGWAFCDGQLLLISEHDQLFNLIGTAYGGDGETTFALPDLRGRVPVHVSPEFVLAQNGGVESVTLTTNQVPAHNHPLRATTASASQTSPGGNLTGAPTKRIYANATNLAPMAAGAVSSVGGSQPHENLQPFLCLSFIISLLGIFPSPT